MTLLTRGMLAAGLFALTVLLSPLSSAAQQAVDPDADTVLHAMADYMEGLSRFSVSFDTDAEIIDEAGQKLMLTNAGRITLERPDKIRVSRESAFGPVELFYDGGMLSLFAEEAALYYQMPVQGTIDDLLNTIRGDVGYDAPGADLLYADVYASLMGNVRSGQHLGMVVLNGVEAHHLAFRTDQVDWQLWVAAGTAPLPLRYVITSKWVTGAPQYAIRLSDWDVAPPVGDALFSFTPPADARRIEVLPINAAGELELGSVQ